MKVYIVYREFDQADSLIAVYSSPEAAQRLVEALEKMHPGRSYFWDDVTVQD